MNEHIRIIVEATDRASRKLASVEKELENLGKDFGKAARSGDGLKNSLGKLDNEFAKLARTYEHIAAGNDRLVKDLNRVQNEGRAASRSVANLERNLRGLNTVLVIKYAQGLITALEVLGGSLISVAASAVQAGSALGGAFVAGAAQAIPVAATLITALQSVGNVFKLVNLQQQAQQNNAVKAAGATGGYSGALRDNSKSAMENVRAHERLRDAQENLVKARKAAARQLQDLRFQEEAARLAVIGSTLGITEAKEALQSSIDNASVTDSVTSIDRAQLGVDEADLSKRRAIADAQRAAEDMAEGNKKGVKGSDDVKRAMREVRDASEALKEANKGLAGASAGAAGGAGAQSAAYERLQYQLKKLTPAERELFDTVTKLYEHWQKASKPISDPIVGAISDSAKGIDRLLTDKNFMAPFARLSKAIAKEIGGSSDALLGGEGRSFIMQMTMEARQNVPTIGKMLRDVLSIFRSISKAASPVFKDFLESAEKQLRRLSKFLSDDPVILARWFKEAEKAAYDWFKLLGSVGEVIKTLFNLSASEGTGLVRSLTGAFEKFNDYLKKNSEGVRKFFKEAADSTRDIGSLFVTIGRGLMGAFDTRALKSLIDMIAEIGVPALLAMINGLGAVTTIMHEFVTQGDISRIVAFGASVLLMAKGLELVKKVFQGLKLAMISLYTNPVMAMFALLLVTLQALDPQLNIVKDVFGTLNHVLGGTVQILIDIAKWFIKGLGDEGLGGVPFKLALAYILVRFDTFNKLVNMLYNGLAKMIATLRQFYATEKSGDDGGKQARRRIRDIITEKIEREKLNAEIQRTNALNARGAKMALPTPGTTGPITSKHDGPAGGLTSDGKRAPIILPEKPGKVRIQDEHGNDIGYRTKREFQDPPLWSRKPSDQFGRTNFRQEWDPFKQEVKNATRNFSENIKEAGRRMKTSIIALTTMDGLLGRQVRPTGADGKPLIGPLLPGQIKREGGMFGEGGFFGKGGMARGIGASMLLMQGMQGIGQALSGDTYKNPYSGGFSNAVYGAAQGANTALFGIPGGLAKLITGKSMEQAAREQESSAMKGIRDWLKQRDNAASNTRVTDQILRANLPPGARITDSFRNQIEGSRNNRSIAQNEQTVNALRSFADGGKLGNINFNSLSEQTQGAVKNLLKMKETALSIQKSGGLNFKITENFAPTEQNMVRISARVRAMSKGAMQSANDVASTTRTNIQHLRQYVDQNGRVTDEAKEHMASTYRAAIRNLDVLLKRGLITPQEYGALIKRYKREASLAAGDDPTGLARSFANSLTRSRGLSKQNLERIMDTFDKLPNEARKSAASALFEMAKKLEKDKKIPEGAAEGVRAALEIKFGEIVPPAQDAGRNVIDAFVNAFTGPKGLGPLSKEGLDALISNVKKTGNALGTQQTPTTPTFVTPSLWNPGGLGTLRARGGMIPDNGSEYDTYMVVGPDGRPVARVAGNEAILNRHQQDQVNEALNNTYGYGLDEMFKRNNRPHYEMTSHARGGWMGGNLTWEGGDRYLRQQLQGGSDKAYRWGEAYLDRMSDTKNLKGLVNFEGKRVSAWIAPILRFARRYGWRGTLTSGYRTAQQQAGIKSSMKAAPGKSNHQGIDWPGGAIDVGGPEARAEGKALNDVLEKYWRGRTKLKWAGPTIRDWGHFSANGRATGGFLGLPLYSEGGILDMDIEDIFDILEDEEEDIEDIPMFARGGIIASAAGWKMPRTRRARLAELRRINNRLRRSGLKASEKNTLNSRKQKLLNAIYGPQGSDRRNPLSNSSSVYKKGKLRGDRKIDTTGRDFDSVFDPNEFARAISTSSNTISSILKKSGDKLIKGINTLFGENGAFGKFADRFDKMVNQQAVNLTNKMFSIDSMGNVMKETTDLADSTQREGDLTAQRAVLNKGLGDAKNVRKALLNRYYDRRNGKYYPKTKVIYFKAKKGGKVVTVSKRVAAYDVKTMNRVRGQLNSLNAFIGDREADIAENTEALFDAQNDVIDARIAETTMLGESATTRADAAIGFWQALSESTGADTSAQQAENLKAKGSGLDRELAGKLQLLRKEYGIDLEGKSLEDVVTFISNLDADRYNPAGKKLGGAARDTFKDFINSISTLSTNIVTNTTALNELTGTLNKPQSFSSQAWTMFRQAIFDGSGGLLPAYNIPRMDVGGYVKRDGLAYLHAGEVVKPYKAPEEGNEYHIHVSNPSEVVDPAYLARAFAFQMKGSI